MPLFPLSTTPNLDGFFSLKKEDHHHLTRVMRLKPGEVFQVLLPDGKRGEGILLEEGYDGKLIRMVGEAVPLLPIFMGIGMIRWSRMEWLAEKLTELGVSRITPLVLARTRLKKGEISKNKIQRLRKISQESIKQCGREKPSQWDDPTPLKDWLNFFQTESVSTAKILLDFQPKAQRTGLGTWNQFSKHILLIGPEGGCTLEEIEMAKKSGFQTCSLGPTIFRTETAAIYSASVLNDAFSTQKENR
jgi:16S rRNA (uracil1498-N3)-methyltransferase